MAADRCEDQHLPLFRAPRSADSWVIGAGGFGGGLKAHADGAAEHLVRTNGWAAGFMQLEMDRIVGPAYRLQLRPDFVTLGIDVDISNEWASKVERSWNLFAESHNNWIDAARRRTFTQILREIVRSDVMYGEAFLVRQWRQNQASGYSTCFQLISPARISNPDYSANTSTLRNGVELNSFGEPIAYWVRNRHPLDIGIDNVEVKWERITRFNKFGVEQVIHVTDQLDADQTRGVSRFSPILQKLEQLDQYEKAEEEAALLGAMYSMAIKSEFGQSSAFDALGIEETMKKQLSMQAAFHKNSPVKWQGSKIPHLFPGESIESIKNEHPLTAFNDFRNGVLQHIARGVGSSYEELTGDFSKTSYSSARASIDVADRAVQAKRLGVTNKAADKMFQLWMYEALLKGKVEDIGGMLTDNIMFEAACTARWIGAPRMVIDPKKNADAEKIRLDMGVTTLAQSCAQNGEDWEDVMEQRAREEAKRKELGLSATVESTQQVVQEENNADDESDVESEEESSIDETSNMDENQET